MCLTGNTRLTVQSDLVILYPVIIFVMENHKRFSTCV
jgi:hypothetical protein